MTRERATQKRDRLAATLVYCADVLRGSLLERTTFHSSGCPKCVRGSLTVWTPGTEVSAAEAKEVRTEPSKFVRSQRCGVHGTEASEMTALMVWYDAFSRKRIGSHYEYLAFSVSVVPEEARGGHQS